MAKLPAAPRPTSVCEYCPHSSQWHRQTEGSVKAGYKSYNGATCTFPGCRCSGYRAKYAGAGR